MLGTQLPDTADHVYAPIGRIREMAPTDDPSWERGFAGMLDYAASKGWMSADGDRVLAHIEPLAS